MLDLYRKSILSQYGKDAGNLSESDFLRNIIDNYDRYLEHLLKMKETNK